MSFSACLFSGLGLPVENIEGGLILVLSLHGFVLLSLDFLVVVDHPKLGVNLFLENLLLKLLSLVEQLLFSLYLASAYHELGLFFSELIGFHFEFPLKSLVDLIESLLLSLKFKLLESLSHLSPDLFGSLKILHEFSFIHLVLLSQYLSELCPPSPEVCSLSLPHIFDLVPHDTLLNRVVGSMLPSGLIAQVEVALDIVD